MARMHEKIRKIIDDSPHLTQKGLADRMDVDPANVNRMLHGQRKIMAEEIPIIEAYLGVSLTGAPAPVAETQGGGPIPAYRLDTAGGFDPARAADRIPRHPAQGSSPDAYAVFVTNDDMAPRYLVGEIAYVHPGRPAEAGRDVLAVPKDSPAFLARLLDDAGCVVRLMCKSEKTVSRDSLAALHAVVGRG